MISSLPVLPITGIAGLSSGCVSVSIFCSGSFGITIYHGFAYFLVRLMCSSTAFPLFPASNSCLCRHPACPQDAPQTPGKGEDGECLGCSGYPLSISKPGTIKMKWTYLLVNFFSVLVLCCFPFIPNCGSTGISGAFFKANLIVALVFLVWDAILHRD